MENQNSSFELYVINQIVIFEKVIELQLLIKEYKHFLNDSFNEYQSVHIKKSTYIGSKCKKEYILMFWRKIRFLSQKTTKIVTYILKLIYFEVLSNKPIILGFYCIYT